MRLLCKGVLPRIFYLGCSRGSTIPSAEIRRACVGKVVKGTVDMSDVRAFRPRASPAASSVSSATSGLSSRQKRYKLNTRAHDVHNHLQIADLDFVLEKHQQDDGFAILCMARPTSDCEIEAQCDWCAFVDTVRQLRLACIIVCHCSSSIWLGAPCRGNISMSEWKGATFFKVPEQPRELALSQIDHYFVVIRSRCFRPAHASLSRLTGTSMRCSQPACALLSRRTAVACAPGRAGEAVEGRVNQMSYRWAGAGLRKVL